MGHRTKLRIHNRGNLNGWKTPREMLKVLSNQRHATQKTLRICFTPIRMAKIKTRMWRRRNTLPLLVELHTDTTTLEINLQVIQKTASRSTWRPSNTTLGNIPKICLTMPQGHMFHYVYSGLVCDSQKLETTQMSQDRRMDTENVVHLHNGIPLSY